jgi:hypothetical protein
MKNFLNNKYNLYWILILFLGISEVKGQYSKKEFKAIICNKPWVMFGHTSEKDKFDSGSGKSYQIYWKDGSGIKKNVTDDTVVDQFKWAYNSSSGILRCTYKRMGKQSTKLVFLSDETYEEEDNYGASRTFFVTLDKFKEGQKVVKILIDDSVHRITRVVTRARHNDTPLKVSAYFPYKYTVTNYFKHNDYIVFGTEGAGLVYFDRKRRNFEMLDCSNSNLSCDAIGTIKGDGNDGIWMTTSDKLWRLTKTDTLIYFIYEEKYGELLKPYAIIGHDNNNNLAILHRRAIIYLNPSDIGLGVPIPISKMMPFKGGADALQPVLLGDKVVIKVKNDTLTITHWNRCHDDEKLYMYEDSLDVIHRGSCTYEFKSSKPNVIHSKISELPFRLKTPYPFKNALVEKIDSIRRYRMVRSPTGFYTLIGRDMVITITESKGLFVYDKNTGEHTIAKRYKYLSLNEVLGKEKVDNDIWPLIDRDALEKEAGVFRKSSYYEDGILRVSYRNDDGTSIQFKGNKIEIEKSGHLREILLPKDEQHTTGLYYDGVDFNYPYIWINSNNELRQLKITKNYVVSDKKYLLNGFSNTFPHPTEIKQIDERLLVFSSRGLGIIVLNDIKNSREIKDSRSLKNLHMKFKNSRG